MLFFLSLKTFVFVRSQQEDCDDVFLDDPLPVPAAKQTASPPGSIKSTATNRNSAPIDVRRRTGAPQVRTNSGGTIINSSSSSGGGGFGVNFGGALSSPRSLDERRRLSHMLLNDDDPLLFKELVSLLFVQIFATASVTNTFTPIRSYHSPPKAHR